MQPNLYYLTWALDISSIICTYVCNIKAKIKHVGVLLAGQLGILDRETPTLANNRMQNQT